MALTVFVIAAPAADAHGDGRNNPVFVVHGLDAFGTSGIDCDGFDSMIGRLENDGFYGGFRKVGYYDGDNNCGWSINHHGSHSRHYASGHSSGGHTNDANIRHLGYHLAWQIWAHASSDGREVDIAAHSMGGLIARYAVAQVERGHSRFPPRLLVEDVVTFGTPHGGTGWARGCGWAFQCDQMVPGSSFMDWLDRYARYPDGYSGWPTRWTTIGSVDDGVVEWSQAIDMGAENKTIYLEASNVGHSDYYKDTFTSNTADVRYDRVSHGWRYDYSAPWPVRWIGRALRYDLEW